ncbi:MAG: exodeoxyribonuclease III [Deltaproteobacteria bacterium]|nr:exodeoxyribonuclease III [Deltaproteobacteria bacterium]
MRVATWNVNSLRVRLPHLQRWVEAAHPDVVCLQETKVVDDKFPVQALQALGFPHLAFSGEKTYNGVAILSRHPLHEVQKGFSTPPLDVQHRMIAATVEGIRVIDCYVPVGQKVGSPKFTYKLAWLSRLKQEARAAVASGDTVVCGDLNVALDDLDVWDPFEWEGRILFHPNEREALRRVLAVGLVDAYRQVHPRGTDYSWWDYRQRAWSFNHGLRIDHVLVSSSLSPRVRDVTVWRETRGWDEPAKPSDHCPVTVDLEGP